MDASATGHAPVFFRYRFGRGEFDESRFELRVDGAAVEVERRALEVLGLLLRHAGEVVTKDELFEQVWAGRVTVDKVLPNAVTKLRRALGPEAERIVTLSRIGYRFVGLVERVAVGQRLSSQLQLAAGQRVPTRPHFVLQRQLGSTPGSEVWLAEHEKTHESRVYKFATSAVRLDALKREATIARLLRESLEDVSHFITLIDWNFQDTPFFIESEFGGCNLQQWSQEHPLAAMPMSQRLELFLQIAEAVMAAHSVGVLHKDLKPANVLLSGQAEGWRVRLTDFGSGQVLDLERLDALGITRLGLPADGAVDDSSTSGTPLYLAPELLAGQTPTVQSDLYALGVMLFQIVSAAPGRPLAPGWESAVADPLLREDIASATHGDPAGRLGSVAELVQRLRGLDQRRSRAERERALEQQMREAEATLARARQRRPYLIATVVSLVLGLGTSLVLFGMARHAALEAQSELARADAINRFLNEDLIASSNPLVFSHGADASLRDVLLAARSRVADRFGAQPLTEASIHVTLGSLLNTLDLLPDAESQLRQALALYQGHAGQELALLRTRSQLAKVLTRASRFDDARDVLHDIDASVHGNASAQAAYLRDSAWALYHVNTGDLPAAIPELESALAELRQADPSDQVALDALRLDLIPVYNYTGHTEQAERMGQALLDEVSQRRDPNPLTLALARQVSAGPLIANGQFDRAQALLKQAQVTIVALAGESHSRNLMLLNDLLDIAEQQRHWPEAIAYAERIYTGMRHRFGDRHIAVGTSLGNWGMVLLLSGQSAPALARLDDAYAQLQSVAGDDNPRTQFAGFWRTAALIEQGQLARAEAMLKTVKLKALDAVGSDPLWAPKLELLRGMLALRQGRSPQHLAQLDAAIATMAAVPELEDSTSSAILLEQARSLRGS